MYEVVLYDNPDEQNGIVIHDSTINGQKIDGTISNAINKIDTFKFGMTLENPGYGRIKPFNSFITVFNTKNNKRAFKGRVYGPDENMNESMMVDVSYFCEGELSYFNDSVQRHLEFRGTTQEGFTTIVNYHNTQVEPYKRFEVGIVEISDPNDYMYFYLSAEQNTLSAMFDKLIDKLGGELRIRHENGVRYIDWLESIGYDSDTEIRLAHNLMSVSKTVDPSQIITRLTPLGERIESEEETATDASQARLTIESVNNGKPYIDRPDLINLFGIIGGSQTWDEVTTPQRLLTNGINWINNQKLVLNQYKIGALDLATIGKEIDFFETGNSHYTYNPVMAIDEWLRIIGMTIDINSPESSSLIIGDKFLTARDYQVEALNSANRVTELQSRLDSQSSQVIQLRSAYTDLSSQLGQVQNDLLTLDVENLPIELQQIHAQLQTIADAIDALPAYGLATPSSNGLMASTDKAKVDRITINSQVDLDDLVIQLNNLVTRIEALEEPEGAE